MDNAEELEVCLDILMSLELSSVLWSTLESERWNQSPKDSIRGLPLGWNEALVNEHANSV